MFEFEFEFVNIGHLVPYEMVARTHGDFEYMMASSNENILRVTGHLCGEFTGHRWIPHTKVSDAELWCFLWSVPE